MSNMKRILSMMNENGGTVTSKQVTEAGISRGSLKYMADTGLIERSGRGVYILPTVWDDEFFNAQTRFKRGVFSEETALFLWDLTDRTPVQLSMTFPATYNISGPKEEGILCRQASKAIFDLGIQEAETPAGHPVRAYGPERTLCDLLKTRMHADVQVTTDAFKRYCNRSNRNIPLLSEYAKKLRVEKKVRAYLEVLI